ncbi:DUF1611 domain-containing protein [Halobacterium jilantaiense]|uniref:Uncharacterized conserved protein, NAD-dependent epimerase/dehydratase family n=1 Tax=Halobacterium jilantaiense TaxID=355548 RepID=A0A1I0QH20_9EURY|nr:DUF1611 domain-containing protein [Halobacterium jilantaiense]SEW26365.1 Uncharacterized conserved protein, NAD-dependent epimerase/dehydratase family [Halobacterium jilantaiense]
MNVALLAHEQFPDRAKTAVGVLRYADYDVVAVLDRGTAGSRVADHVPDVQDAPVVASMDDVGADVDALVVGIAPIGGGFEESWRPDVRTALERGADVYAGLHYFLADDEEFAGLAAEHGCDLWDVRSPPEDIGVAEGTAGSVDATVVTTVGTDCSVGKMTATRELYEDAREQGMDAAFVATGQTGILIEGEGVPVDRVVSDFAAGAVEAMVLDAAEDHDYVFVEGQGSIVHPAYSGVTASIVHGSQPDHLVLCHEVGRESVHGYDQPIPPVESFPGRYEQFAGPVSDSDVVGGMLNTRSVDGDEAARDAVAEFADTIDAPADDPVRFGTESVLEAIR